MTLDILGITAHPDDAELSFGGTLLVHKELGYATGIVDLTEGELGTRGTPEIRAEEAKKAGKVLGLSARENLRLPDGFFEVSKVNLLKVVEQIRRFRPKIVITNAVYDRHPDHGRGAELVETAFFLAGLREIKTNWDGKSQQAYRPDKLYYCIQSIEREPDLIVDISHVYEKRDEAIHAFKSQFFDPESSEPATYISSQNFIRMLKARSIVLGQKIGVDYAEGFTVKRSIGVKNLFDLV
ncbi:MAG: bacillithiol biosynthesis deacetylase BshB1, partial [Bacteroidota bacterium]